MRSGSKDLILIRLDLSSNILTGSAPIPAQRTDAHQTPPHRQSGVHGVDTSITVDNVITMLHVALYITTLIFVLCQNVIYNYNDLTLCLLLLRVNVSCYNVICCVVLY